MAISLIAPKRVNDNVCNLIAKALVDAKGGATQACALVAIDNTGAPTVMFAGSNELTPQINLGADMLKACLMRQILDGGLVAPIGPAASPPDQGN